MSDIGHESAPDVLVVGGGIIGLAVAWRAVRDGLTVAVADPSPGSGASHAAAGMLAPVSEVTYTDEPLLRIGLESLARWPAFAAELADASGVDPDHRTDGTLDVAFNADDMAALDELAAFMGELGLAVTRLTGRECRRLEPMLAPAVRGGLYAEDDAWVDPRRVTAALLAVLDAAGVPLHRERVTGFVFTGPAGEPAACRGVRLASGRTLPAGRVVLAAGAWSGFVDGLPPGVLPPVRPVKGQIMRLRSPQRLLTRCVRGMVYGSPAYLVPRGDGEVVLGATQEEMGFDDRVTAGGVYELLRDARELVPGVTELELVDVVARPRPGTPDNLPLIGPTAVDGLVLATGHHRGGVLLAPLTADTALADDRSAVAACSPLRFADKAYGSESGG